MPIAKPVWGPTPELLSNNKLNAVVDYSQTIHGAPISQTAPVEGNSLVWDDTAQEWKPSAVAGGGGSTPDASTSVKGAAKLSAAPADPVNPIAVGTMQNVGGVLSGSILNPGFAVDMATQAELDAVAAAKANVSHTQTADTITDFTTAARNAVNDRTGAPVSNLTELRGVVSADRNDKQTRLVENTGFQFRFDAEGTGTDDGDGIIAPTVGIGRWFKIAGGGSGNASTLEGYAGAHYLNADNHISGTTNKVFTATEKTKLAGIASDATANDTDANLRNRASHSGTQSLSTITGAGTAAALNVAAIGNAAAGEVVKGSDTRLSDARTPTAHNHTAEQISNSTTVGRSVLTATDEAAARAAIGAGIGDVTLAGAQALSNKTLINPAVTTQAVGDNSAAAASTAFVQTAINGSFIGARGERASNLACADGNDVAVPFTSEQFDTSGFHDNSTNNTRFTVPANGIYLMVGSCEWTLNTTGRRQIILKRNGSTEIGVVSQQAQTTANTQQNISCVYSLSAGDYVEMMLSQVSGASINAIGSSKFMFSIVRVA